MIEALLGSLFDLLISGKLDGVGKRIPVVFRLIFVAIFGELSRG